MKEFYTRVGIIESVTRIIKVNGYDVGSDKMYFVYKHDDGDWYVVDKKSGLSTASAPTKARAIDLHNERFADIQRVKKNPKYQEQVTIFTNLLNEIAQKGVEQ